MQIRKFHFELILLPFLIFSCSLKSEQQKKYKGADYGGSDGMIEHDYIFEDGEYCAEVKCFNPRSEKKSTYSLLVNIEDNKLTKIEFPKGGWLDESHFIPPKPNEDQYFEFTDDRGNEYQVALLQDEGACDSSTSDDL